MSTFMISRFWMSVEILDNLRIAFLFFWLRPGSIEELNRGFPHPKSKGQSTPSLSWTEVTFCVRSWALSFQLKIPEHLQNQMVQKFLVMISEIRKLMMNFQPLIFKKPLEILWPGNLVEYKDPSALRVRIVIKVSFWKSIECFSSNTMPVKLKEKKPPSYLCLVIIQQLATFLTNIYWFSVKQI